MGKEPDQIEQDIEETRARMGDRVDALTYKSDVKARVGESIAEKPDNLVDKVKGLGPGSSEEAPSGEGLKDQAQQATSKVKARLGRRPAKSKTRRSRPRAGLRA